MFSKLSLSLTISLLLLIIPLLLWAQLDNFWIPDDILIENTEGSIEPEINLQTLDLYWSADTYVPFGYQGRPLPAKESWVDVNADLKISGGDPKNLKYSWFLDGIFQEAKSGYGRDSLKFGVRRTSGASHAVLLKIFNESRSFYVEKSITIPIVNPEIVVYHKNNALPNLSYLSSEKSFDIISDKEATFLALPYFFSIKSLKDLEFKWILGEKTAKESSLTANVFGLRITNKQVANPLEENLKVIVINKLRDGQKATKNIILNIY